MPDDCSNNKLQKCLTNLTVILIRDCTRNEPFLVLNNKLEKYLTAAKIRGCMSNEPFLVLNNKLEKYLTVPLIRKCSKQSCV